MSCEDRGRYRSDGSTSQGMPRTANNRSQEKAGNSFCPRATKTACHADRTSCLLNHGENKHLLLKATRFMLECYGSPTKPTEKAEGGGGRKGEWKSPRAPLTGPEEGSWKLPSNRAHSAWTSETGSRLARKPLFWISLGPTQVFITVGEMEKCWDFLNWHERHQQWLPSCNLLFYLFIFFTHLFEEFVQMETCSSKSLYLRVIS